MPIRHPRSAIYFLLIVLTSCVKQNDTAVIENVKWIHGSTDCKQNADAPIQVIRYNLNTWILRQNKCLNYEAPFLFVLMGEISTLLIDTGATKDSLRFPLRHVVDSLMHLFYRENFSKIELVVAHTHAHGDHHAADSQFIKRTNAKVVGLSLPQVQSFFGITNWPNQLQNYDLGKRVIDLIPIPGHEKTSLAFYDRETGFLFSGDTFYPGRLYVEDWQAFGLSIKRLVEFSKTREVKGFIGNHIEMTNVDKKDYPIGTTYQPEEHDLLLSVNDLNELYRSIVKLGDTVKRVVFNDFIIFPTYEPLPKETNIYDAAIATIKIDGYPDFMRADVDGAWVTNVGQVEKLKFGEKKAILSVNVPQPCGVMATGFGSLWVADCKSESVYRVNLNTGKVQSIIKTGLADREGELSIAISEDAVWLLTDAEGELSKIDPLSNKVVAHVKVAPHSFAVVFGYDALWITNTENASVQQVDPKTNKVVSTTKVGKEPRFLAAGLNAIWTLNQEDGTVSKIDPVTKDVKAIDVDVEGSGGDITVGSKYVYVRAKKTLLSVIDPQSNEVISRFGPAAGSGAVCVENGHVWVTAHDINQVWVLKE
ncbi:MAG: MBL fold metallo-hydrolase [Bacteroidetes bacterium]|nr:MBL fold metallo-hydrolase [Bacteroidota bacterium]